MGVGLREVAGHHARPELPVPGVRHVVAGQQPQEVRLAGAVGAEDGDPFAVEDLQVEGFHQAGEFQLPAGDGADAGAAALQAHPDVLLARRLGRRPGLLELAQPGLGGAVAGRHVVTVLRGLAQRQHQLLQLGVLLVPAAAQFLEAGEAFAAGLVEGGEATAVHPGVGARGSGLDRDDLLGGAGQQFPVVGDEQHGLAGLGEPLLQPALAGHVEVVVRLVEQQHLVGAAQQRLQDEAFLFTPGQGAHLPPLGLVVRHPQRGRGAHVPQGLRLVPPRLGPVGERLRVGQLGGLVVHRHDRVLGGVDGARGLPDPGRRDGHQQVAHGGLVADGAHELAHHAEAATDGHGPAVRSQLPGQQAQQGGLARAVGSDEGHDGPLPHPEGDVAEERPPVGEVVLQVRGFEVTHGTGFCGSGRSPGKPISAAASEPRACGADHRQETPSAG